MVTLIGGLVLAASALASTIDALVLIPARRRAFRLEVTAEAITMSRGRWLLREDVIPLGRVTVVRTRTGPWARLYRHSDITVVATTTEVLIPPLARDDAETFAAAVARRSPRRDAAPQ
jgi:membrane protein YdbS with pleckstrin-like domain